MTAARADAVAARRSTSGAPAGSVGGSVAGATLVSFVIVVGVKIRVRVLVVVHVLVRVLPLELERLRVDRGVRGGVEDVEERNGRPRAARV